MNRLASIRSFVLLSCVLLPALMMGCTEKTVTAPGSAVDGNLVINIEAAPAETLQLVTFYRLTVSGGDMETVVDTLRLIQGQYLVGEVQVPVGERRLFVLEGVLGPAATTERVIYRGQTVAAVRPGTVTHLDIALQPVAPIAMLSPSYSQLAPTEDLTLSLRVYNVPNLVSFRVSITMDDRLLRGTRVVLADPQAEGVWLDWWSEGYWLEVMVADTAGGTVVGESGKGILANLSIRSLTQVGEFPISTDIIFESLTAVTSAGDTVGTEAILAENAHARLLPLADRVVVFPDPILDAHIRNLDTSIHAGDPIMLSNISDFTAFSFPSLEVTDLTGIENMINLTWMDMSHNPVGDISVLAGLPRLTSLYAENNGITDITPLTGLTRLHTLDLAANVIVDLRPLAGMHDLVWLDLNVNQISDLSPLSGLTELSWLYLGTNQIVDISALQSLTGIQWLELQGNQIVDLLPLVNNPGLGSGDRVDLSNNGSLANDSVQFGHIQTLITRGVTVIY